MWEAINKRISVRNYAKEPIKETDITIITELLDHYANNQGPFGHKVKFFISDNKSKDGEKIGTYGFIKNPPMFIGGVVKNTFEGMVDFGFLFEEIILRLTNQNLGTVWLGGTFDRNDFMMDVKNDEIIAAISPVGYPEKQSIREKVIRKVAKSNKRKPFNELFFLGKDLTNLSQEHPFYEYLHAVQVAPSASNKQPWRVVVIDDTFHFYLKRTVGYGNTLKMDIQAIDMGIALSHLYLTLKEDKCPIEFINQDLKLLKNATYVLSIKTKIAT